MSLEKRRVFVIRPWNNPTASLYPHTMDGVEYIDAVISALKTSFPPDDYDVRVDADVFIPGESLRQNVEREITDAELVLVLLDGLRPNVVYEFGMAHAFQKKLGSEDGANRRVIPLAEKNATVLVRNFYRSPLEVPLHHGGFGTPLNPLLEMSSAFSDGADILLQRYDRLRLFDDIKSIVNRIISSLGATESKGLSISEALDAAPPDIPSPSSEEQPTQEQASESSSKAKKKNSVDDAIKSYQDGDYNKVIYIGSEVSDHTVRKLMALSLMRLGRIYDAINLWRELRKESTHERTAIFHLGVCHYAITEFEIALSFFQQAVEMKYGELARIWLERTKRKLGMTDADLDEQSPGTPPDENKKKTSD